MRRSRAFSSILSAKSSQPQNNARLTIARYDLPMTEKATLTKADIPIETMLRDELAYGDIMLGTIGPIMGHLLANHDNTLFSDEIVSRVGAMLGALARQLLQAYGESAELEDIAGFTESREDSLAAQLAGHHILLRHCHALALETQLTEQLDERSAIDRVLSPLLQELIASEDDSIASTAMAVLAAQARFVEQQRRMELPLTELPGDLFHNCLQTMQNFLAQLEANGEEATPERISGPAKAEANSEGQGDAKAEDEKEVSGAAHPSEGDQPAESAPVPLGEYAAHGKAAANALRKSYDEGASRLGLLTQLILSLGGGARAAIAVNHSGVALFLSALSEAAHQQRDLTVISTNDRQAARLVLALRAAGLKPKQVQEQFHYIHPYQDAPEGLDMLRPDRAMTMLASSVADGPIWETD